MKKLAVLRDNENNRCPFKLPIPAACKNIGDAVLDLSFENEEENNNILNDKINSNDIHPCFFANKILKDHVICDLDEDELDHNHMPVGSPLYFKPLSGSSFFGTYMNPAGYYNDNSIDRSYQTLYSIENIAFDNTDNLNKLASSFLMLTKSL